MSLCVNCQHYWSNGKGMDECTLHNQWTDSIKECDDFASKHKQTNADKIRSMTDKELCEFICGGHYFSTYEKCLEWLKAEVEA